jgi:hypothetical protein
LFKDGVAGQKAAFAAFFIVFPERWTWLSHSSSFVSMGWVDSDHEADERFGTHH